jgi:hypothetical protein
VVPLPYNGNESNKSTTKMYRTECHTVWAPFRGNAGGTGAFDGPFSLGRGRPLFPRKAGRASFLAISGHKPVGTRQTSDQPDRTNTDRGADRSFPGRWAERAFSQSLGHKPMGTRQTRTSQTRTSSDQVAEPACCLLATLHHTNQTALGGSTIWCGCAHSCAESKLDGRDNH